MTRHTDSHQVVILKPFCPAFRRAQWLLVVDFTGHTATAFQLRLALPTYGRQFCMAHSLPGPCVVEGFFCLVSPGVIHTVCFLGLQGLPVLPGFRPLGLCQWLAGITVRHSIRNGYPTSWTRMLQHGSLQTQKEPVLCPVLHATIVPYQTMQCYALFFLPVTKVTTVTAFPIKPYIHPNILRKCNK